MGLSRLVRVGVYMAATAGQLPESDLDRGLTVFSIISRAQGLAARQRSDIETLARHRLYRATALQHFVLSSADERLPVGLM